MKIVRVINVLLIAFIPALTFAQNIKRIEKKEDAHFTLIKERINGQIKLIGEGYNNGKKHGVWAKFKSDSTVKSLGRYNTGRKVGLWHYGNAIMIYSDEGKREGSLVKYPTYEIVLRLYEEGKEW